MTITVDVTGMAARAPMRDGKPTHHPDFPCVQERTGRILVAGRAAAAGRARRFVRELLGPLACLDDVLEVVSELVTNAVLHTGSGRPGGLVTVEITVCEHLVRLAVIDQGLTLGPLAATPAVAEDRFGGQGLFAVVSALSIGWGTYSSPGGRVVWAELAVEGAGCEGGR